MCITYNYCLILNGKKIPVRKSKNYYNGININRTEHYFNHRYVSFLEYVIKKKIILQGGLSSTLSSNINLYIWTMVSIILLGLMIITFICLTRNIRSSSSQWTLRCTEQRLPLPNRNRSSL